MGLCDVCNKNEVKITMAHTDGDERLCLHCYNEQMVDMLGVELESHLESFSVNDDTGVRRNFVVSQKLDPIGIFIEAKETIEYGYRFVVHGEVDCNQSELFQQLIDKVNHGVAKSYLTTSSSPSGFESESIIDDDVVGRLEYDGPDRGPLVIIDGKPYTWEQLGDMVMSFEGFQFKLKMFDPTDDVE
ncbi:DUF7713 domain-containing protein [Aquibacillus salsiterrae]|uniref:Uncharacterized protein n=1 Tax=Aquibacillus salsiterrae TaxID=2950439 RepID=A0A9X3WGH1_9BACI|nr:hypothetical protein [Aquibacillus salsiterrae]MDC3418573.1 hypothetical protein [Aquibacillus salsiterrae]